MRVQTTLSAAMLLLAAWASAVNATTITVYTDKALWEAAVSGQYLTEDFADSVLNLGVSYDTVSGHINPSLEKYQDVLASFSGNEPETTWSFTPPITAYGGTWDLGGPGGGGNSLHVTIPQWSLNVGYITSSYEGDFWGFTSDTPFTSVKLMGGTGTNQQQYSLDDMVYFQIPEPAALLLLALGSLGLVGRRRYV